MGDLGICGKLFRGKYALVKSKYEFFTHQALKIIWKIVIQKFGCSHNILRILCRCWCDIFLNTFKIFKHLFNLFTYSTNSLQSFAQEFIQVVFMLSSSRDISKLRQQLFHSVHGYTDQRWTLFLYFLNYHSIASSTDFHFDGRYEWDPDYWRECKG